MGETMSGKWIEADARFLVSRVLREHKTQGVNGVSEPPKTAVMIATFFGRREIVVCRAVALTDAVTPKS